MLDQLRIGDKYSYLDFDASVAERKITKPKKKSIKETVPFSNTVYDFSRINGEIYWDEATLEYVFEITADSAEELEEKKQPFIAWVMNVMEEKLYDPYVLDYHYIATYEDMDIDDSEIEKSTITVTFKAYPYMIANDKRKFPFAMTEEAKTVSIRVNSSHRIVPTISTNVECNIIKGNSSFGIPAGEITDEKFMLSPGENTLTIKTVSGTGTLNIEFYEEVF